MWICTTFRPKNFATTKMKKSFVLICLCLLTAIKGFSQETQLNNYLYKLYTSDKIMASAAVSENGQIIFEKGYGHLNAKSKDWGKVNAYTKYRIGATTKLFTAVIAMKLVEQGALSLNDKLSKFYKSVPNSSKITVQMLLNHHSGIADYSKSSSYRDYYTEEQSLIGMIAKISVLPPVFKPGEKAEFSSSNYLLLGGIIEQVSGMDYDLAVQKMIVEPLGMKDTYYAMDATPERNEASSFSLTTNGWKSLPETHMSIPGGAGGLVSTPADLCVFIRGLFSGKLVSDATLELMMKQEDYYGLGLLEYRTGNEVLYGHTGVIDGFSSLVFYHPKSKTAVAICANGINYNIKDAGYDLFKISQGMDVGAPDVKAIKVDKEKLSLYTGEFYSRELGKMLSIDHIDQTLMARLEGQGPFPLTPVRENHFVYDLYDVKVDYEQQDGNVFEVLKLTQGTKVVVFERR